MSDQTPPASAGEARPVGLRVLVVDDRPDATDTLAMLLKLWGHQPTVAYTAAAALELTQAQRPDVVLLDIGLPGMDGREVARRIRQQPGMAGALLVAVTGHGGEQEERSCREAGFDRHLLKPFDPEDLRRILAAWGRGPRGAGGPDPSP
jgi:CheY-like chemotaxis protein